MYMCTVYTHILRDSWYLYLSFRQIVYLTIGNDGGDDDNNNNDNVEDSSAP